MRLLIFPLLILIIPSIWESAPKYPKLKDNDSVGKILYQLGDDPGWYPVKTLKKSTAAIGKELFHTGFAKSTDGKKGRKQSKHFVCTSCHNIQREDSDLTVSDPQGRLDYTMKAGIPFLQGTTMYGAVSRRTFYNDDYSLKYGNLVDAARNDLRGAIQLCAVECAQGRQLKTWELESILKYLWTIDLKVKDLQLTNQEKVNLELQMNQNPEAAIATIQSRYMTGSPATFVKPENERKTYDRKMADINNGENIFLNSCMHCHENGRYSFFELDTSKVTMKYLQQKANKYTDHSIYQAVRYGIYSTSGRKSYMPQYPLEKMSEEQLLDLRGYIEYMADR